MALSFVSGTMTLANWGFSTGDIALLAGAGRQAGTWLMSQIKDRGLIEFMNIDIDSVLSRKGIVNTTELHLRWDKKLRLLRNNRPYSIESPRGSHTTVVDNMDRFTWLMTLIVAALDPSVSYSSLNKVAYQLLAKLFRESPVGADYLQHEIPRHVQGWHSGACVRGILLKTRKEWHRLAEEKRHWPGDMPPTDNRELCEMLFWLVAGTTSIFTTASSDVFCIGIVLQRIGVEVDAVTDPATGKESAPRIHFDVAQAIKGGKTNSKHRLGMRIPLNFMQECVSLWPGDQDSNNYLRQLFEDGINAVEADGIELIFAATSGMAMYEVKTKNDLDYGKRVDTMVQRAAHCLFPKHCHRASRCLGLIFSSWTEDDRSSFKRFLGTTPSPESFDTLDSVLSRQAVNQLQAFIMGFYYKIFYRVLDCSYLSVAEAFGNWTYHDLAFFRWIAKLRTHFRPLTNYETISRAEVLAAVAYFFAGVDGNMLSSVSSQCVGLVGKLGVLTNTSLGRATQSKDLGLFCLLDVDLSCIPSSSSGMVTEGKAGVLSLVDSHSLNRRTSNLEDACVAVPDGDFSTHLEPDWDYDMQSILVVFRHKGRIVYKVPPSTVESAFYSSRQQMSYFEELSDEEASPDRGKKEKWNFAELTDHHGGHLYRAGADMSLIIPTFGCPHARACILSMYLVHSEQFGSSSDVDIPVQASTIEQLKEMIQRRCKYVITTEGRPREKKKHRSGLTADELRKMMHEDE